MNAIISESDISLARQLFKMTWPMTFGVLSLMSFQLVDSAFIGQLGVLPLAAQGFTLPIQMIIIGVQVGLGIATTAVISRALGRREDQYAKQLGGLVLTIGSIGVGFICCLIWLIRSNILALLSAPGSVYSVINSYWPFWLLSAWAGALLYFYYSICRSNGNTMLPGIMMIITSIINIVLDPIFIFTLDLGIRGAAVATIISFAIGIILVAPNVYKKNWICFNWDSLNVLKSVRSLAHIMGPAMTSQLLPPVSSMLATKLIAGYGTAAVAAWALGSRFEFFAIVCVLALTMSMPPMVGRLLGANKIAEIRQLVTIACKFILIFQFAIALITFLISSQLAELMTSTSSVASILNSHLLIVPLSLGPLGVCMLIVSVSNALGRSYAALTISTLRLFAFFLPFLWIGSQIAQIKGLFVGVLVGNILAGITSWIMYQRLIKKLAEDELIPV